MKILVTGAGGFIGKNLCVHLREAGYNDLIIYERGNTQDELDEALLQADFIFHLAGVNRPDDVSEFQKGNADLTSYIVNKITSFSRAIPILVTSSIQAAVDNPYGNSKAEAEKIVEQYAASTGASVFTYRLPNVFGKWCRHNYNSVVATFCHNIVNDLPITVNDADANLNLVYIDDVCRSFISHLTDEQVGSIQQVSPVYQVTLGQLAQTLLRFKESQGGLNVERVGVGFERALYATYLSYFDKTQFSYTVPRHGDERGVFVEMLKTKDSGQFSFFTAHPGVTRGGHYHHTKNEKFLVIKGMALFKFRHIMTDEVHEILVNGSESKVVETVPGWSHDITNVGDEEMVVMLWANEVFDTENPDTMIYKV